jgi:hypothetical protein
MVTLLARAMSSAANGGSENGHMEGEQRTYVQHTFVSVTLLTGNLSLKFLSDESDFQMLGYWITCSLTQTHSWTPVLYT